MGQRVKRADRRQQGLGAIELIEQAVHQLRAAPPATLASYYLGALPFVLGLLFFWADMSRSAFAEQHLAGAALGVAALYLWMKFWQVIFARNLRTSFAGEPPPPLGLRRICRILVSQAVLQSSGLFLLPLAAILMLPFGWACAFYQNLTVHADADAPELRRLLKSAARQAALWPRQNHTLLAVLLGFGFCVFLNWVSVCLVVPALLKMLLGVESIFTRSPLSLLNTTFLMAMLGLTYLSVDPIVKTAYALRCFYGESVQSGEDLKAELKRLAAAAQPVAACLLVSLALWWPGAASAAESAAPGAVAGCQRSADLQSALRDLTRATAPPAPEQSKPTASRRSGMTGNGSSSDAPTASPASLSPAELDRAIKEVIQQTKYAWRMPREKLKGPEAEQSSVIGRFLQRVGDFLRRQFKVFFEWLGKWLRKLFPHRPSHDASGYGWVMLSEVLLYALLAAVVVGLVLLLIRLLRTHQLRQEAIISQPIQPAPDLADESLSAEELPEDRWMALAHELLARGELRLAVRAFYFASLAHLAERNLISLARFKSNRDYERELRRRGHSFPDLLAVFGENVLVMDRTWYGVHPVSGEQVDRFAANVERIKAGG